MLDTLLKIGEWQQEKLSKWDRVLDKPNITRESRGKSVTNYVVGLVFDLDENDVYPDSNLLKEYEEERDPEYFKAVKIQGGRNKSVYATVPPKKTKQIFKTYFNRFKKDTAEYGQLIEAIDKDFSQFQNTQLYQLVKDLFPLRDRFVKKATKDGKTKFKYILDAIELGTYERLALVYAAVKSEEHGFDEPYPIARLEEFEQFLSAKFLEDDIEDNEDRLCYASGTIKDDVKGLDLSTRFSLNKMFVTTTQNYATLFDKKSFSDNYQISAENQERLDLASDYLLDNYSTGIADIDHVIIPQFRHSTKPNFDFILHDLKAKSDLLFRFEDLDKVGKDIKWEIEEVFWLNFVAYESDGNFFKTLSLIKDVSKFHFQDVLEAFFEVDITFEELQSVVKWDSVKNQRFNLNSVYGLIPIRKEKEKKNIALSIFKAILEQRKIEKEQLFQFFSELMLCHYYQRYNSYTNVRDYSNNGNRNRKEYFLWAVRDSVFKYLAFIQVLKKLNLINMEQEESNKNEKLDFGDRIENFFTQMGYNDDQKALFYLGRMLNDVQALQEGKSKTVVDKLNFNGMDKDQLQRLSTDLFEKKLQYKNSNNKAALKRFDFNQGYFNQLFDYNHWEEKDITEEESLFFILTGYTFGIVKQEDSNLKND